MRRIQRPSYVVPTLSETGVAGKKRQSHCDDYEIRKVTPQHFPDYWKKPDVRGLLHAMQGRICAYCLVERPLDVEHFRPKSHYWWLAYEPANLLLGCTACNRDRKVNQFPLWPALPP
jgi:5-methylcytosine-specific restriction endonuclease McrA